MKLNKLINESAIKALKQEQNKRDDKKEIEFINSVLKDLSEKLNGLFDKHFVPGAVADDFGLFNASERMADGDHTKEELIDLFKEFTKNFKKSIHFIDKYLKNKSEFVKDVEQAIKEATKKLAEAGITVRL